MSTGLRERGKQQRTQRILDAARELLRERPERSPSVEAIAARAEVSPATVFNLVGTRERIWAALADEALAEVERRLADAPEAEPQAQARRVVATTVRVLCADAPVYRAVLAHWAESGALLERDPTGALVAALERAAAAGDVDRRADLAELARLIACGCTGAVHQWAAGMIGDAALRRRCERFVDLAFGQAPR